MSVDKARERQALDGWARWRAGSQGIWCVESTANVLVAHNAHPDDLTAIAAAHNEYPLALDVIEAVAKNLPAKHQAHYSNCGCLDDSDECCGQVCECHALAAFEAATE